MSQTTAIALYAIVAGIVFLAFGMQRTTLLLGREADAPTGATSILLPSWFPAVWLPRIGKWVLVFYIGTTWSWLQAIGLAAADFILSVILPIPHRLYVPIFRNRVAQLRTTNPEIANALSTMIEASSLTK